MDSDKSSEFNVELPWLVYRKYFKCVKFNENLEESKKSSYTVKCNYCKFGSSLSTPATSNWNLKRHIKTQHAFLLQTLENELATSSKVGKQRTEEPAVESASKPLKQTTLHDVVSTTSQGELNSMIARTFVDGNFPFKSIELPTFKKLIKRGYPKLRVMGRKQLSAYITKNAADVKRNKKEKLKTVDRLALTLDLWTVHGRSYMGVTCHWLENNMQRKNTAIALKRVKGRHTYDVIAKVILDVCNDYEIQDKIGRITTDSASNFVKAFKSFGRFDEQAYKVSEDSDNEVDGEILDEEEKNLDEEGEDSGGNQQTEDNTEIDTDNSACPEILDDILGDVDARLEAAEQEIYLPPHHRCASHKFNLIATSDANKAEYIVEVVRDKDGKVIKKNKKITVYGKKREDAITRCKDLWNLQGRSQVAKDSIHEIFGRLFPTPGATRWNSEKDALEYLYGILTVNENRKKLNDKICSTFDIAIFRQVDVDFIHEYLQVMTLIATALDNLQGDKNMYMGILLPNVLHVHRELQKLVDKGSLIFCRELAIACIKGISERFKDELNDRALILASASHPEFKLNWVKKKKGLVLRSKVKKILKEEFKKMSPTVSNTISESNKKSNYLLVSDSESDNESDSESDNESDSPQQEDNSEIKKFLSPMCYSVECLNRLSVMKNMFLKYNTPLPSSGSVERMFSIAGDICTRKRGRMSDMTFESTLLFKYSFKDDF